MRERRSSSRAGKLARVDNGAGQAVYSLLARNYSHLARQVLRKSKQGSKTTETLGMGFETNPSTCH